MNRTRIAWFAVLVVTLASLFIGTVVAQEETGSLNTEQLLTFWQDEANRNYDHLATLVQPDFVRHSAATAAAMPGTVISSRDAYLQFLQGTAAAFPDYHVEPVMLTAQDDTVAFYANFVATPPGASWQAEIPMLGFMRFEDGLLAEAWVEWDNLTWASLMAPVTEAPIVSADELIGTWQLAGPLAAQVSDLQFTFDPDGHFAAAFPTGAVAEDEATFAFEDGQIHWLTSERNPACAEGTYIPTALWQGEQIVALRFALEGEDCYTERVDLTDGQTYMRVSP